LNGSRERSNQPAKNSLLPSLPASKDKFPMARNKIALIGSGQIGGTLAHLVGLK
jgi:hypothetical protein